jgi:flagellar basal-body rod protein FlgB
MINRIDSELGFHQRALSLRAYRQEVLASNIANADTPHYKARDIDFKASLQGAMGGQRPWAWSGRRRATFPPATARRPARR